MASRSSRPDTAAKGALLRLVLAAACLSWAAASVAAPQPAAAQAAAADGQRAEAAARRVNDRVRALHREAERLAGQARTLLGDVRRLEIERDLAAARAVEADAAVAAAAGELQTLTDRVAAVQRRRVASLPDLKARFVELYKQRGGSYARMLASVRDLREFGRATRAVASLAQMNQRRIADYRKTLEELRRERDAVERQARELAEKQGEARRAHAAAERAIAARTALLAEIDRRRDLNAQLAGELQVAQRQLEAAVRSGAGGTPVAMVSVPLAPFRGALDWPVSGRVVSRFGSADRGAAGGVKNGIEIEAPEGTPVRAVHPGVVGYADVFAGYGTLVILDHGDEHYSLYAYLSAPSVERGQHVAAGDELGRVGVAPAGNAALYFEVRVDGVSVDPVQWLKPGR